MKSILRGSLLMALAILNTSCAGAPAPRTPGSAALDTISMEMRRETFDFVWNRINDTFWDPARLAALDWAGVRERYLPRAMATPNSVEYHRILHEMTRELHLSHFAVVGPGAVSEAWAKPGIATGDIGARLRILDGDVVVTRVNAGAAAEQSGLRLGFILDSIDGMALSKAIDAGARKADGSGWSANTPRREAELPASVVALLEGPAGSAMRVAYRDAAGVSHAMNVTRTPRMGQFKRITLFGIRVPGIPAQYTEVEARRLEGGVAYVRFSMFLNPIRDDVIRAIRSMGNAPGLIIDLRGNAGGQDGMGRRVANLLVEKKTPFVVTRSRGKREVYSIEPDKPLFRAPVVVLVDAGSGSASEQLTAGLQEIGRVTVIGERTMGRDLDATLKKLPTGGMLQYAYGEVSTPKGVVIEGRGVIPDRVVPLTRAALLTGRDPQIDAALAVLQCLRRSSVSEARQCWLQAAETRIH